MKSTETAQGKVTQSTATRPTRSPRDKRSGVVLLIVVLLVLILAIIGTALLSTTGADRVTAIQNSENTQVDMYVDGVVDMVRGTLIKDLFGDQGQKNVMLPASPQGSILNYATAHESSSQWWLASRVPSFQTDSGTSPKTPFDSFIWRNISYLPHLSYQQNNPGYYSDFVSPLHDRTITPSYVVSAIESHTYDGVDYPAAKSWGDIDPAVAADADGDGVYDAGFFPLTYYPRSGITYLAAVRIIDNCAALNVNTAWNRDFDIANGGGNLRNDGYFPSGVGLRQLLSGQNPDAELAQVNYYRFGGQTSADPTVNPDGNARADFRWSSQGEALSQNVAFRMGNPGFNGGGRYRPFSPADTSSLAYRYLLVNPEVGPSPLESAFMAAGGRDSIYRSAPNYDPDPSRIWKQFARRLGPSGQPVEQHLDLITRWFGNFDYNNGKYSMRPLLVTSNAVSRYMRAARIYNAGDSSKGLRPKTLNPGMLAYESQGTWTAGRPYGLHEIVKYNDRFYASTQANNTQQPSGDITDTAAWDYQPWSQAAKKADLNTGTFRDLWRSYWCTFAINQGGTTNTGVSSYPQTRYSTGTGGRPAPEFTWSDRRKGQPLADPTPPPDGPYPVDGGIYRFVQELVQIRSALAAVNTMGLRDRRHDVISRTFTLHRPPTAKPAANGQPAGKAPDWHTNPTYKVDVFSHEYQPVISELMIDTRDWTADRRKPIYVAVELYNPYDEPINLKNWRLARIVRKTPQEAEIIDIGAFTGVGITEIPAGNYVVVESTVDRPKDVLTHMQGTRRISQMPLLAEAVGMAGDPLSAPPKAALEQELVLLRPRRGDGVLTKSTSENNTFDEGFDAAPNLSDLVPVDQMDLYYQFTDLRPEGFRLHYSRNTAEPAKWEFFFPGRYGPENLPKTYTRYDGFSEQPNAPGSLGMASDATSPRRAKIKLSVPGWPGANPISAGGHQFPHGGFARVGDVLRVPHIGSYVIRDLNSRQIVDVTAVTADAAYCDVEPGTNGSLGTVPHNIGRFLPDVYDTASTKGFWKQHYSMNILECFTIRRADNDFAPHIAPENYGYNRPLNPGDPNGPQQWEPLMAPTPIANTDPFKANVDEPLDVEQGLVNVNTANWRVLSTLPLVTDNNGVVDPTRTIAAAKEMSEENVARLSVIRHAFDRRMEVWSDLLQHSVPDYLSVPADDWEQRFEPLMRVSNLITTRSDSFTVYLVVEGWRDCYTPEAKRVLQRRVAFVADRSAITPSNRELKITNIPTR